MNMILVSNILPTVHSAFSSNDDGFLLGSVITRRLERIQLHHVSSSLESAGDPLLTEFLSISSEESLSTSLQVELSSFLPFFLSACLSVAVWRREKQGRISSDNSSSPELTPIVRRTYYGIFVSTLNDLTSIWTEWLQRRAALYLKIWLRNRLRNVPIRLSLSIGNTSLPPWKTTLIDSDAERSTSTLNRIVYFHWLTHCREAWRWVDWNIGSITYYSVFTQVTDCVIHFVISRPSPRSSSVSYLEKSASDQLLVH